MSYHLAEIKLIPEKKHFQIKGQWDIGAPEESNNVIAWRVYLEEEASKAPEIVRASDGNPLAIIVQDKAHTLYCLETEGTIKWKKKLDGQVMSNFHPVDYYQNGEIQLLFNTRENIYLLDQEGLLVGEFPISLEAPATNGLSVVHFEGNSFFYFFVSCSNGNSYGFDQNRNPLPGWSPHTGLGILRFPLIHFQDQAKDYLIALNDEGRMSILARDGIRKTTESCL